jgi:integrase
MARTIRDANLETRAARGRLAPRGKPYYRTIEEGLHLGYRKPRDRSLAGKWVARHYLGEQAYEVETIGAADDFSDADGIAILSYAQAQAAARGRMVSRTHAAAGKTGPLTVADAIEDYLVFLETNRKSAADSRARAKAHIIPALGETEVESLTTEQLSRWHANLADTAPRIRTSRGEEQTHRELGKNDEAKRQRRVSANKVLTILRAALNRAWRAGKTSSDAAWRRVEPFAGVNAARIRYLSVAEAQRLVNACDDDLRVLVQAALQTGARYAELARLTVADFNAESGTVAIRQSKTNQSRHVVLTDEGVALFRQLSAGHPGDTPLIRRSNGRVWGKSEQARPMRAACERAKIKPTISFHGLRHTWASLAVMGGVPLLVVAKNLGHADARMVERHYGHLAPSYIADAIRAGAPRFGFKPDRKIAELRGQTPRRAGGDA